MSRSKWFLIGKVGVDSGQLMIVDPGYVDEHWVRNTKAPGHPAYKLTAKGIKRFKSSLMRLRCSLFDKVPKGELGFKRYDDPIKELDGLSMNDARDKGLVEEIPEPVDTSFSYHGACSVTGGEEGAGSMRINFAEAVAFRSGYGDGCYEVWGRKNADGRIVEVQIKME